MGCVDIDGVSPLVIGMYGVAADHGRSFLHKQPRVTRASLPKIEVMTAQLRYAVFSDCIGCEVLLNQKKIILHVDFVNFWCNNDILKQFYLQILSSAQEKFDVLHFEIMRRSALELE